jgi:hypothetical protein
MSVAMIMKDEDRHLTEMGDRLASLLPDWRFRLGRVLVAEQRIFEAFMQAVAAALAGEVPQQALAGAEAQRPPAARAAISAADRARV